MERMGLWHRVCLNADPAVFVGALARGIEGMLTIRSGFYSCGIKLAQKQHIAGWSKLNTDPCKNIPDFALQVTQDWVNASAQALGGSLELCATSTWHFFS